MVRIGFYLILLAIGVVAGLGNPVAAVIGCLEAYLLNPVVFIDFDVRFQLITTLVLITSYLVHSPRALPAARNEGSLLKALWAFVALGALSALWAQVSPEDTITAITELAKTVVLVTLLVRSIRNEKHYSYVITACLIGIAHAAFLHTFGVRLGYVPPSIARSEAGMLPDMHGSVMVLFFPSLVLLSMMGTRFERLLCWLSLPFVLSSIVTTNQRTYFLAMLVESGLILLAVPKKHAIRLLLVFAIGGGLFAFRLTSGDYWQRMSTITDPTREESANSRILLRSASQRILADYPFGVGYRNYPSVSPKYLPREALTQGRRSAHNSYFTIACETGIPGFLIWSYAFGGSLYYLRRLRKGGDKRSLDRISLLATGLEVGLYGWICGGLTQSDHDVDPAYWFIAFTIVLVRLRHQDAIRSAQASRP
ncbi:O-Antigen ligase [Planctomyces sp. SH-PL62]|nr:O-Antigen ligase [Planctomyces sp. SH-PL62]